MVLAILLAPFFLSLMNMNCLVEFLPEQYKKMIIVNM